MRARLENVDQTRRRITEATMRLHEQVGPAATTVSAVADRAGVTRVTVYRHFPDDEALIGACAAHWGALHPPPDTASWLSIDDPERRLRAALLDLYAWARAAAPMMTKIYRDLHVMPTFVGDSLRQQEQDRVTVLAAGFAPPSRTPSLSGPGSRCAWSASSATTKPSSSWSRPSSPRPTYRSIAKHASQRPEGPLEPGPVPL